MLDDFLDFVAVARQFARQQVGRAGAKQRLFMNDHDAAGRTSCGGVQNVQVGHSDFRAFLVAGTEAEGVFQATFHNLVGHAHIDHMGQVVLGSCLGGGQANGGGKSAHHGTHASFVHFLDLCAARLRIGLGIPQQGFQFGAAQ